MALSWNITMCDNWKDLTESEEDRIKTHTLVFVTMGIGMNEITKKNYRKFYQRYLALIPTLWEQPRPEITLKDIKRRIGLYTNASTKSNVAFLKEIGSYYLEWAGNKCEREEEESNKGGD